MSTQTISPTNIYNIRPDIFMRGAEDRLHIQYSGENYILRLRREVIDTVYRFLDLNDGARCLADVMGSIPAAHRPSMAKFLDFLLTKRAAFRVTDAIDEAALAPVNDTLTYLRSYCDDSAAVFRRFENCRILVVANGYALISAIKTFSHLGVRQLTILQSDAAEQPAWHNDELTDCFNQLQCWPDATLRILQSVEDADADAFSNVLQIVTTPDSATDRIRDYFSAARHGFAFIADGNVCMMHVGDAALLKRHHEYDCDLAPPDAQVAGAVASLAYFNEICSIRILKENQYQYFGLNGEEVMRIAQFYPLVPSAAAALNAPENGKRVANALVELSRAPLFPLRNLVERTAPDSYIKIYSMDIEQVPGIAHGQPAPAITVFGAGLTKDQCQANMLLQLISLHDVWFGNTLAQESSAVKQFHADVACAMRAVAPFRLQPAPVGQEVDDAPGFQEAYITFCINAAFGQRLRWSRLALDHDSYPLCAIVSTSEMTIYLPHAGELAPRHREAALFALYTALWQVRHGQHAVRDVVLTTDPFLAESEQ